VIFHLVDVAAWKLSVQYGDHRPESLTSQGFIHLSTRAQVLGTANRFFRGRSDLLLLSVDETQLAAPLKYEEGEPGQLFPHLYGPLPLAAVLRVTPLKPDASGGFAALPED
jgi:uncharacterized protein (DUF952 family)